MSSLSKVAQQEHQTFANWDFLGLANTDRVMVPHAGEAIQRPNQTQSLDNQLIQQIFNIGGQLSEAIGSIKSQKSVLEIANYALEDDIAQIKKRHVQELNALVDGWETKAKSIVEKLGILLQKLKSFSPEYGSCGPAPIETSSLGALIHSVPQLNDKTLRNYPEYKDSQTNKVLIQEESVDSSSLELFLIQTHPLVQRLIQDRMPEIESLTEEVSALRAAQFVLRNKKEGMIEFHRSFIEVLNNKMQKQLDIRKIYETTRSILGKIEWDRPITSAKECPNCSRFPVTPRTKQSIHATRQTRDMQKLKEIHEKVEEIMSSIRREF